MSLRVAICPARLKPGSFRSVVGVGFARLSSEVGKFAISHRPFYKRGGGPT
jgi:hypothetical protein